MTPEEILESIKQILSLTVRLENEVYGLGFEAVAADLGIAEAALEWALQDAERVVSNG